MPAHSVGMSEFDWIARYFAPLVTTERAAGLLDDVAELSSHARIITTDALVEGVHFLPSDPIETVARKLVRVNISDILAKGGVPGEALLTLGWPKGRAEADLAGFAKALGEELDHWGASLIGGDTVTAPGGLFLSLTLTGHIATGEHIIRRSGAKAGDGIWITGKIGAGGLGLADAVAGRDTAARTHYRVPDIPPLALSRLLQAHATSSMDVSDGLIADLGKICRASDVGARVELEAVPLFSDGAALKATLDACTAGDDYQCLFTAPQAAQVYLEQDAIGCSRIGLVTADTELQLRWQGGIVALPENTGFDHQA